IDELRERARARVRELHGRGVAEAYLYGDVPTASYSELNSFYLLVDRPAVYGLPDDPVNPWLSMKGDYARAIGSGLAAIAMLLAAIWLGGILAMRICAPALATPLRGGYRERTITHAPPWGGLRAWGLLFHGITTGLF